MTWRPVEDLLEVVEVNSEVEEDGLPAGEVLKKGMFCTECEYLEDEDDIKSVMCMSCGCPTSDHVKVKVVRM